MLLFPDKAKKFVAYVRKLKERYSDKATYKRASTIDEARTSIINSCGLSDPTGANLIDYLVRIHGEECAARSVQGGAQEDISASKYLCRASYD